VSTISADLGLPPALTDALVDDAAVFPPGDATVAAAVAEHRRHRAAGYHRQVGPLLLRAAQAEEATGLLRPGERLRVALVCRPGSDVGLIPGATSVLTAAGRAEVVGVELAVADLPCAEPAVGDLPATEPAVGDLPAGPTPRWLEVSRDSITDHLDRVSVLGSRAKLRTGGVTAADFPDERLLAGFIVGCQRRGLRFKLTAGLHHAVRGTDPSTGLEHHGIANVLLATARAAGVDPGGTHSGGTHPGGTHSGGADHGCDPREVAAILADGDRGRLAAGLRALGPDAVAAVRSSFASFGCCGVTDPITELAELAASARP
jgi:hypothetical protein